jgi:hypothetical protein
MRPRQSAPQYRNAAPQAVFTQGFVQQPGPEGEATGSSVGKIAILNWHLSMPIPLSNSA